MQSMSSKVGKDNYFCSPGVDVFLKNISTWAEERYKLLEGLKLAIDTGGGRR